MTGLHTNPSSSRESLSLSCPVPLGRKAVQGINLDGMGFSGHLVHQGIVGQFFLTLEMHVPNLLYPPKVLVRSVFLYP